MRVFSAAFALFTMCLELPEKSKENVVWPKVVHTLETRFKITVKFET